MTTPNNPRDEWMNSLGYTKTETEDGYYTSRNLGMYIEEEQADFFYQQMLEARMDEIKHAYIAKPDLVTWPMFNKRMRRLNDQKAASHE